MTETYFGFNVFHGFWVFGCFGIWLFGEQDKEFQQIKA
jgi:hypothetical protein